MPPGPAAPCSLAGLLAEFRPCFTAPTFQTFIGLVVGLIAQTRRRTVCGMLIGAGLDQVWHHSRAHRLFTNARWSGDALGLGRRHRAPRRAVDRGDGRRGVYTDTSWSCPEGSAVPARLPWRLRVDDRAFDEVAQRVD